MTESSPAPAGRRSRALVLLLRLAPARRHAVVTGFPDDEGNSVEIARALAHHLPVTWLTGEDPDSMQWLIADAGGRFPIRTVRKDSLRAYLSYLTSRWVFFTHGLYGSPQPPRRKTFVNLWHGDGPKKSKGFATIRSTYAVAGTRLWGEQRPVYFGVDPDGVLVTGNPRIDQFQRPTSDEQLRLLGVDPQKPLVVWMPTYRRTEYHGRRRADLPDWADGHELSQDVSFRQLFVEVARAAHRAGVLLAVKPHPLDADRYDVTDVPVIGGEELRGARTTVYQLLGRCSGLITDYSSVWTDFLAMDRPIGLHCPDIDEYEANRGLNVEDYRSLIPGPLLETADDFESFFRECVHESVESKERRRRSAELIGAQTRFGASRRLIEALGIPS